MKKHNLLRSQIFLACCLVAGGAHAQINFKGDTLPTGDFGGRQDFNATVYVGELGTGSLDIASSVFSNGDRRTEVGRNPGSIGTVNISNGGEWVTGTIWSGLNGQATFNISNGSKATTNHTYLGMGFHGQTIATVDGPGSSWIIPKSKDGDFWIGSNGGSGTLRILNGATVSTTSDIYAAMDMYSSANIEIDGANSSLSADTWCYLGMGAPASVKITNGGMLRCGSTTYLGWGNVALSGAGSKWIVARDLDIGRNNTPTKGVLDLGEGSSVEIGGNLRLGPTGTARGSSGMLNIEGSSAPGVVRTQNVVFGDAGYNSISFKHSNASGSYIFSPSISGRGLVNVFGNGTTVLTGNNTFIGTFSVQTGVLRAGSATAFASDNGWNIGEGGMVDTDRYNLTASMLFNSGVLSLDASDTSAVLTVNKNYRGSNGVINLNGALGGNDSPIQKLIVGEISSGVTTLNIRNRGGAGGPTTGNGILVVQVGAISDGQFRLPRPGYIQVGAYRYNLVKVGRNWYLQSTRNLIKAASADEQAACTAGDPLAAACTVTPGNGTVAATKPAALTASAADAAAAADADAAAPAAETSAALDGTANGLDDIKDGEAVRLAEAVPVPGLGAMGMVSLSSLISIAGLRRSRKSA